MVRKVLQLLPVFLSLLQSFESQQTQQNKRSQQQQQQPPLQPLEALQELVQQQQSRDVSLQALPSTLLLCLPLVLLEYVDEAVPNPPAKGTTNGSCVNNSVIKSSNLFTPLATTSTAFPSKLLTTSSILSSFSSPCVTSPLSYSSVPCVTSTNSSNKNGSDSNSVKKGGDECGGIVKGDGGVSSGEQ
jgi:uncharacterized membrane protein YgcG